MKSIEQAARCHDANKRPNAMSSVINRNTIDSFKAGVEFAQRWIPIEEELPPLDKDSDFSESISVLVKENGHYHMAWYNYDMEKWFTCFFDSIESFPTHWRPIELK